jgi:DNA polymerase III epsilon subunit-like protein
MIVVDVETTGIDPTKHGIIDIAARDFNNPTNTFHCECQLKLGAKINQKALEINGFTKEEITDPKKPTLKQAVSRFLKWSKKIEDRTIAGHNPDFDINFLHHSARLCGLKWNLGHRKVDQHSIIYQLALKKGIKIPLTKKKISGFNSDVIMDFVGLPVEPKPHKALNGVTWETEALSRLIYAKNLLPQFKEFKLPSHLS